MSDGGANGCRPPHRRALTGCNLEVCPDTPQQLIQRRAVEELDGIALRALARCGREPSTGHDEAALGALVGDVGREGPHRGDADFGFLPVTALDEKTLAILEESEVCTAIGAIGAEAGDGEAAPAERLDHPSLEFAPDH